MAGDVMVVTPDAWVTDGSGFSVTVPEDAIEPSTHKTVPEDAIEPSTHKSLPELHTARPGGHRSLECSGLQWSKISFGGIEEEEPSVSLERNSLPAPWPALRQTFGGITEDAPAGFAMAGLACDCKLFSGVYGGILEDEPSSGGSARRRRRNQASHRRRWKRRGADDDCHTGCALAPPAQASGNQSWPEVADLWRENELLQCQLEFVSADNERLRAELKAHQQAGDDSPPRAIVETQQAGENTPRLRQQTSPRGVQGGSRPGGPSSGDDSEQGRESRGEIDESQSQQASDETPPEQAGHRAPTHADTAEMQGAGDQPPLQQHLETQLASENTPLFNNEEQPDQTVQAGAKATPHTEKTWADVVKWKPLQGAALTRARSKGG